MSACEEKNSGGENGAQQELCQNGHSFGAYQTVKEATCKEAGKEIRTCSVCGKEEEKEIPKTENHSFGDYKTEKEATCKDPGKQVRACSVCGKKEEKEIPKTENHSFGDYKTEKEATCKEVGKEVRTCSVCGKTEEKETPKTENHSFGDYKTEKAATCKEMGKQVRTCSICGKKEDKEIPKTDQHSFGEYIIEKEASCKEAGKQVRTCSVCGKKEEKEIPKTENHSFGDYKTEKEASCKEAGKQVRTCSVCGKKEEKEIPRTENHSFGDFQTEKEATCKEVGKEVRTCSVCGKEEEKEIPKTENHSFGDFQTEKEATCKEAGKQVRTCSVCGKREEKEIPKTDQHSFGEYQTVTPPTCVLAGEEKRECSICGKEERKTVSPTGDHNYVNGKCGCGAVDESYLPPETLFAGNVFRIELQNMGERKIGTSSGFVFHRDGWFLTTYQAFSDAYYAYAVFQIPNQAQKSAQTRLPIQWIGFADSTKDILIGKIENFSSIANSFRAFSFETSYQTGDTVFSVGFRENNEIAIQKGVIKNDGSHFDGKLQGVQYIAATNQITQECRGGILLNDDLNVIGLLAAQNLSSGTNGSSFSVSASEFQQEASKESFSQNQLSDYLHAEEKDYVRFLEALKASEDFVRVEEGENVTAYIYTETTEAVNDKGVASTDTEKHEFRSDLTVKISITCDWKNRDSLKVSLTGRWNLQKGCFDDLSYECIYTWADGQFYKVKSSSVNYSQDLDKTLTHYSTENSTSYTVTDQNIRYAKEQFNYAYEWLIEYQALLKNEKAQ